jgi:aspartate kinase
MLIFKFGGASVKSADGVKNIAGILQGYSDPIIVVLSAMGKTTNALELITELYAAGDRKAMQGHFDQMKDYHMAIVENLFGNDAHGVREDVEALFAELAHRLEKAPTLNYDFDYDQIVCYGELISSRIVAHYLAFFGLACQWKDVRRSLKTDDTWREARVDWQLTEDLVKRDFAFGNARILLTQGFLGSTINDMTTTLGREGSDFTAAILAHVLKAERVVIWKDVPGVLNADPKWFDDTVLLRQLSYLDAIELAYYGASVIHPKTIKPLQNRNINLHVKSFVHPEADGTVIGNLVYEKLVPSFIFKMNQVLLRISPRDFSFIDEDSLQTIFGILNKYAVKINMMQNSAVQFFICTNYDKRKLPQIVDELDGQFKLSYETGLELITIRYFDPSTIDRVMINKELILEQRGQQNIQLIVRDRG